MIRKVAWASFTAAAIASNVAGGAFLDPANPLATPDALFVENMVIVGIGTWALLELIRQGKRGATKDDLDKLRDDLTAHNLDHRDQVQQEMQRALDERERVTDLQFENLSTLVDQLQGDLRTTQERIQRLHPS